MANWNFFSFVTILMKTISPIDNILEKVMAQILVVDDSAAVRNEVTQFLRSNGLDVESAVDGNDGFQKFKQDPAIKLIISDINMPNLDGLSMVEKIRGELGNKTVNIIMLTTESDARMKERGKASGVKGWIVKPFKGDAVVGGIKKLVGA